MQKVLVVGELNADLILNNLDSPPTLGKEVLAQQMTLTMGSSSAIFACNLSSIGTKVSFVGKLGDDMLAKLILKSLKEKDVDTTYIMQSKAWQTGVSVATCIHDDREMVTYAGAMKELSQNDISDEMLDSANHLHVSSVFLQPKLRPGIIKLFKRAKDKGLTTSLDPQFDPAEKWDINLKELLPHVDVFLPNRSELLGFTQQTEIEKGLETLKPFANILVMKDGAKGAWIQTKEGVIYHRAFLNKNVIDVIGAGDSFDAGFIHQFLQKKSLEECIRQASIMGALNTTANGGTEAFDGGINNINQRIENYLKTA